MAVDLAAFGPLLDPREIGAPGKARDGGGVSRSRPAKGAAVRTQGGVDIDINPCSLAAKVKRVFGRRLR